MSNETERPEDQGRTSTTPILLHVTVFIVGGLVGLFIGGLIGINTLIYEALCSILLPDNLLVASLVAIALFSLWGRASVWLLGKFWHK